MMKLRSVSHLMMKNSQCLKLLRIVCLRLHCSCRVSVGRERGNFSKKTFRRANGKTNTRLWLGLIVFWSLLINSWFIRIWSRCINLSFRCSIKWLNCRILEWHCRLLELLRIYLKRRQSWFLRIMRICKLFLRKELNS